MQQITADMSLWNEVKESFTPIKKTHQQREMPKRLYVHKKQRQPVSNQLDLHHKTVQGAYLSTQEFIQRHVRLGTTQVQIITGKGHLRQGAIRTEFEGWLDTPQFRKYISKKEWTNDKGAMNLCLKKSK